MQQPMSNTSETGSTMQNSMPQAEQPMRSSGQKRKWEEIPIETVQSMPSSDAELSESMSDSDGRSEADDEVIVRVMDRDHDETGLIYKVVLRNHAEPCWMGRSDLWDDGPNSNKIEAYDFRNQVDWDEVCEFCGAPFEGPESGDGCEECRCDCCEDPCRHFNGINYGCPRHPVV